MSPAAAKRRLAKLEGALSPRAAVLLWLEEAQAFHTLHDYVIPLLGKPLNEYPLQRLGARVEAAARADLRGQPLESVEGTVRKRRREALFLFELVHEINLETHDTFALEGLRFAVLAYQMRCLELEAKVPEYLEHPYDGRPLAERWQEWHEALNAFLSGLYEADETRLLLERRYLDGHASLFPEFAGEWETLLDYAEGLASWVGLLWATPGQEAMKRGSKRAGSRLLDLDALRAVARAEAPAKAAHLADGARCATLDLLGDSKAANSILERRLRRFLDR